MAEKSLAVEFENARLTGGPVYMPQRLQDIVRMFLRFYLENATFKNLNADERKICPSETDFELVSRWAHLDPKTAEWPFPDVKYDYDASGPWPQPKAVELDKQEHDAIIEHAKKNVEERKAAKLEKKK